MVIESEGQRIIGVRDGPGQPANSGRLCTKGATLKCGINCGSSVPELRRLCAGRNSLSAAS